MDHRGGAAPGQTKQIPLMMQIVWMIPRIYHRLTGMSEQLYGQYGLTAGKRSLLRDLNMKGPHTIAEMVRVRPPITRQYIQRLITELKKSGYVELQENPADRRSKTVFLTKRGREVLDQLAPEEQAMIVSLFPDEISDQLATAKDVLEEVVQSLEAGSPKGVPPTHE